MCSWPSKPLDFSPPSQCLSRKIQIQTSLLSNAQTLRKESLCWYFWLLLPQVSVGKHKLRERAGRACFQLCSCGQSMGFEFTGSEMEVGRLWVYLLLHFVGFFFPLLLLPPGVVTEACREGRCKSGGGHRSRCRSTGSGRAAGKVSGGTLCVFLQRGCWEPQNVPKRLPGIGLQSTLSLRYMDIFISSFILWYSSKCILHQFTQQRVD